MGAVSLFSEYPGTNRAICASLALVLFWTPVHRAVADAVQDSAKLGQAAARKSIQDFPLPAVSEDGQTLTLFRGTGRDLDIPAGELFPESGSGGFSTFTGLYGDDAGTMSSALDAQTALKSETSRTGEAYRTLIQAADRSHPDLTEDPVWKTTDWVMANHGLFAKSFADCTSTTVFGDKTSFLARSPEYRTCLRSPNPPPACTAKRQFKATGKIAEVKLGSVIRYRATYTFDLKNGTATVDTDYGPSRFKIPKLDYDEWCGAGVRSRIRVLNVSTWYDSGLWAPDGGSSVDETSSPKLLQAPTCKNGLVGKAEHWDNAREDGPCGGAGCDLVWVSASIFRLSVERIDSQDWVWSSAACPTWVDAFRDGLCKDELKRTCRNDPFTRDEALGEKCFLYDGGTLICESDLTGGRLVPGIEKTCNEIEVDASGCDLTGMSRRDELPCWTGASGATVCAKDAPPEAAPETCADLEKRGCAFIRSECVEGAEGDETGACWRFSDTYDCGTTYDIPTLTKSSKMECPGAVRCMGEECVERDHATSKDFVRAAAALNAMQHMAMDKSCVTDEFGVADCGVFKGEGGACKTVGYLVDCCNAPTSMGLGQYIDLITNISQMNNAVMRLDATNAVRSGWEVLSGPVTDAWGSVTELYAGAVDSTIGQFSETAADFLKSSLIDEFSAMAMEQIATWVGDTFGGAAGNLIFSSGGAAAFSESGALNSGVSGSTLQVGGGAAYIGTMLNVVMIAYAVYQIITMIIKLIYECEQKEYELAAKKNLKSCVALGSYSDGLATKYAYCCFSSPLARILQEQIRPQLGMSFGDKKSPDCSGIPIEKLAGIDWNKINLDEWIAILQSTNHLPTAANAAQKLNLDRLTGQGSRFNVDGTRLNTRGRNVERMKGLDIPAIRNQAEGEGWGMGPKN